MKMYLLHLFIPMILSNIGHMLVVKKDAFPALARPISRQLFGANKTWRGLILLPLLNGILFWLVNRMVPLFGAGQALAMGALLGLTYMLFELPNSWLKRRLGITSGEKAMQHAGLFMLLDKTDSAIGVSLMSKVLFALSWKETIKLLVISVLIHTLFSALLVAIGIKKRF